MHVLDLLHALNWILLLDPVTETELNTQFQTPSDWNHRVQWQLGSSYAPNQVRNQ